MSEKHAIKVVDDRSSGNEVARGLGRRSQVVDLCRRNTDGTGIYEEGGYSYSISFKRVHGHGMHLYGSVRVRERSHWDCTERAV